MRAEIKSAVATAEVETIRKLEINFRKFLDSFCWIEIQ